LREMMPPAGANRTVGPFHVPSIIRYVAMPPPQDEPVTEREREVNNERKSISVGRGN
jgi:hypothetical protein